MSQIKCTHMVTVHIRSKRTRHPLSGKQEEIFQRNTLSLLKK